MADFVPIITRDKDGFLMLHWPTNERHETMVAREVMVQMVDDLNRLRAAGDALAMHLDAHYGLGAPCPSDIRHALDVWQEARLGQ